jgi:hypothetical protein
MCDMQGMPCGPINSTAELPLPGLQCIDWCCNGASVMVTFAHALSSPSGCCLVLLLCSQPRLLLCPLIVLMVAASMVTADGDRHHKVCSNGCSHPASFSMVCWY